MTETTMAFLEYLRNIGKEQDADFLRKGIRLLTEALTELEVSQQIGAERYERSGERTSYRNGYRERLWQTRVGDIGLHIPKGRDGHYFPSFLEPRRRPELALLVTAADEQDRVGQLAQRVQQVTGDTVEVAFVDQGYTGDDASQQVFPP